MANAESAIADIPSFRYRVSGMDCAKDAAQILHWHTVLATDVDASQQCDAGGHVCS